MKKKLLILSVGAFFFLGAFIASRFLEGWTVPALYLIAYVIVGGDVIIEALEGITHFEFLGEEFLMFLATIGAFATRNYPEAIFVMLFFQIGEMFQDYAVDKSEDSIKALLDIRPDTARLVTKDCDVEVNPSEVKPGDTIKVLPGERVALDGEILNGSTTLDTSAITGESMPVNVSEGDSVTSGCVNLSGVILIKTTADFERSTVSRILELVSEAKDKKANAEKFITKFAKIYTPSVVAAAVLLVVTGALATGDIRTWIYRAMTFLLVSCPCALVISIPLSFFGGIGGAGRYGILIKGGNYMEAISKISTLVLDKTGTITKGNFMVTRVEPNGVSEDYLVKLAASAERFSNHPIAVSIAECNKDGAVFEVTEVKEHAGRGLEAVVNGKHVLVGNRKLMDEAPADSSAIEASDELGTIVYVSEDGRYIGSILIEDELKDGIKETLDALRNKGIRKIVMLTGDNERTAASVAAKVGIDNFKAGLSPIDKVTALENILNGESTGSVAFAGDGINDAPVITRADVGFAMGAMGSEAAIEAADVVIMDDDISKIGKAVKISQKTIRIVKENILLSLIVKAAVLVLAAFGYAPMWAAVFSDVGVSVLAVFNAMRALR